MKIYNRISNILIILLCIFIFYSCSTQESNKSINYEHRDGGFRVSYSIDQVDSTEISYEITPEVAAYIAKGVFINIHGEEYVNERELKVYENTELLSDIEKYGEFYEVSLNLPNYTDGEYIAISKMDGRILKVYWFG